MENKSNDEFGLTEEALLVEATSCFIERSGSQLTWRQAFLRTGRATTSGIVNIDESQSVCVRSKEGCLALQCLFCGELFLIKGCRSCGEQLLRTYDRISGDGIREHGFLCDTCGSKTRTIWTCPKCGSGNAYHLTLGVFAK
jgi:hypothetical protein